MKKFCLTAVIAVFLLIFFNGLQAQTTQTKLNQIELSKKFIGSWKCEYAKDTTIFWDGKPFGTGLECYSKTVSKGKIISEGKELYGYDKSIDKCIDAHMEKGMDIGLTAFWFITNNKYVYLPYSDVSNSEKASRRSEGEFKSPDMMVETTFVNNKPVKTITYTRVK
jgi:hypothetical protein